MRYQLGALLTRDGVVLSAGQTAPASKPTTVDSLVKSFEAIPLPKIPDPMASQQSEIVEEVKKTSSIPVWVWIGGGVAVVGLAVFLGSRR